MPVTRERIGLSAVGPGGGEMTGGDHGATPAVATIAAPRETATKIAIAIAGRKIPATGPLREGANRAVNLLADRSAHKYSSLI